MPNIIDEGSLRFTFPDEWNSIKFDDTNFYRDRLDKLNNTKAIDILAKYENTLHFIEVKDFRQHRIENQQRQTSGELMIEVAQKFRDTLAGLVGAARWNNENLSVYFQQLLEHPNDKIEVVLFLERDDTEKVLAHKKIAHADLKNTLQQLLKAYNVRCRILSIDTLPRDSLWTVINNPA